MTGRRRIEYVPQFESADCGPACLAMVLSHHGVHVSITELRGHCGATRDGVSARSLVEAAKVFGLDGRALRIPAERLAELPLPLVLHWRGSHFVVLSRIKSNGVVIIDPALGFRYLSWPDFSREYSGIALTWRPNAALKPRPKPGGSWTRVLGVLRGQRKTVALLISSAIAIEALAVIPPAVNQFVVDHVILGRHAHWFLPVLGTLGLTIAISTSVQALRDNLISTLQSALNVQLQVEFLSHMLRLPLRFFEHRSPGDLMHRVHLSTTARDIAGRLLTSFVDGFLVLGYAVLMVLYHWQLGLVVSALSLVRVSLAVAARGIQATRAAETLEFESQEQALVTETLNAGETVQAFGVQQQMTDHFDTRMVGRLNAGRARDRFTDHLDHALALVDAMIAAAVLWLAGYFVLQGGMTLGVLAGFLSIQGLLLPPLASLLATAGELARARSALSRVADVSSHAPDDAGPQKTRIRLRGAVELRDVSFRHGAGGRTLLHHIDLRIDVGEFVAIVGPSGSGKTTLLRLVLGLLRPTEGQVLVDGFNLNDLDDSHLRRQVGCVLQEHYTVRDTLESNLRLASPDAAPQALITSLQESELGEWLDSQALGLQHRLSECGRGLSGGQLQRLAMARALLRHPPLLILDEPTSALDTATEERIHDRIAALGCTRIVVAHRLSTIRKADRIVVINQGRIVEQGTYDGLRKRPGLFNALVQASG